MKQMLEKLNKEARLFQNWASTVEQVYEWEANYPYWNRVYTLVNSLVTSIELSDLTQKTKNSLMYLIARDNEVEEIASILSQYPNLFIPISKDGLSYNDPDARWQLAHYLSKLGSTSFEVEEILLEYYKDTNEYVKRRALLALGFMHSKYAEQLAIESWNTNLEYQKIAALNVLDELNSSFLDDLVVMGEEDAFETVRFNASSIKSRRMQSQ